MCVPKTGGWADSLRTALSRVYEPTTRQPVPWLLSGDAALALQGVDIEPDVIEFRAASPFAAAYFSAFMKSYELPANSTTVIYRRGGITPPSESWRSNVHQSLVAWVAGDEAYWYGRWNVQGLSVQVLHARGVENDPIAAMDPGDVTRVHFEGMDIAVVPLEVLLADSALRGQQQVTNRILQALRSSGYRSDTLSRALDLLPFDKASRLMRLLEFRLVAG